MAALVAEGTTLLAPLAASPIDVSSERPMGLPTAEVAAQGTLLFAVHSVAPQRPKSRSATRGRQLPRAPLLFKAGHMHPIKSTAGARRITRAASGHDAAADCSSKSSSLLGACHLGLATRRISESCHLVSKLPWSVVPWS